MAAIAAALVRPQRITVTLLRTVMGATLVGSLFGLYEHIEHNWEFAREIRPQRNFLRSAYGYAARRQPTACTRHFGPGSGPGHCRHLLSPCTASTRLRKLDRFFSFRAAQYVASFRARPAPGNASFTPALVLKWDMHGLPTTLSTTPLSFQPGQRGSFSDREPTARFPPLLPSVILPPQQFSATPR